jgi:micrococcal nuclease
MVNLVILREGYVRVLTVRPNTKYQTTFLACQREAREAGRGLWAPP